MSVLVTGLSYGLCTGMLDNYLVEVAGMELLFIGSAVLGLCSSAYATAINKNEMHRK